MHPPLPLNSLFYSGNDPLIWLALCATILSARVRLALLAIDRWFGFGHSDDVILPIRQSKNRSPRRSPPIGMAGRDIGARPDLDRNDVGGGFANHTDGWPFVLSQHTEELPDIVLVVVWSHSAERCPGRVHAGLHQKSGRVPPSRLSRHGRHRTH